MSTTARKTRKRAGIKFTKAQKVGTPVEERAFVTQPVHRVPGDAKPAETQDKARWGGTGPRSAARVKKFIASGGIK